MKPIKHAYLHGGCTDKTKPLFSILGIAGRISIGRHLGTDILVVIRHVPSRIGQFVIRSVVPDFQSFLQCLQNRHGQDASPALMDAIAGMPSGSTPGFGLLLGFWLKAILPIDPTLATVFIFPANLMEFLAATDILHGPGQLVDVLQGFRDRISEIARSLSSYVSVGMDMKVDTLSHEIPKHGNLGTA